MSWFAEKMLLGRFNVIENIFLYNLYVDINLLYFFFKVTLFCCLILLYFPITLIKMIVIMVMIMIAIMIRISIMIMITIMIMIMIIRTVN